MPTVSIIIPHHNDPGLLAPCLESLHHISPDSPSHEVVVVDDASTDNSVERIQREHPWVRVVRRGENGGFIQAIESGVRDSDSDILVFLNNDTWVERDWLQALVAPLLEGRLEGVTGSILMDWEGKTALYRGVAVNVLGYGFEIRGDLPDPQGAPIPVLSACGAAMAIPRSLYVDTGGFDESYGMIYEDLDLGWRLNLLGYDCCLIPASRAGHRAHASLGRAPFERKARYYLLNPLRTLFKNWDPEDHLEQIQMAVTLAQARERICLLGQTHQPGAIERLFGHRTSTPLVESLVQEEERTLGLARKREKILTKRKRSTRDLFVRFMPEPLRPWFFDEEQRLMLERAGYWAMEGREYRKRGLL
jgi:GT2 family glycosyltransferase